MGFSIDYDYRKYEHDYSIQTYLGYLLNNGDPFFTKGTGPILESYLRNYKIKIHSTNAIRLKVDYWLFPFLNIYGLGGKIYDYTKICATLQVNYIDYPPFSKDIKTNGWLYGFGAKSEFMYHNFRPQIEYTIYWNHFDEIKNKSVFQTISPKLGYVIPIHKTWIKNINIHVGATYNHIKIKNHYLVYYDEITFRNMYSVYQQPGEEPLQTSGGIADFITLKNIWDWNMNTGVEIELWHHFHYKFEAVFLGKETSISTGISYRLFGKK